MNREIIGPSVSVIIPTYNRAYTLKRSIESVINQTYTNWELLIIDDRSNDSTKSLIEEYNQKDSRIRYLLNEYRKGPGGARNYGIDHTTSKYIAFLDSDDEWLSNHLSECINVMETEEVKVCSGLWYENKKGNTIKTNPREYEIRALLRELNPIQKGNYYVLDNFFCEYISIRGFHLIKTSTLIIDKSVLNSTGKFDSKLLTNQDVDLFFRIIMKHKLCFINNYQAIYYQGNDNLFFFENAMDVKDKEIIKKLNFHRKFYLKCYKKRKGFIKKSNGFIYKELMLQTTYKVIYNTYDFLSKRNAPFNKFRALFYSLHASYYSWKFQLYSDKGKKFFFLSLKLRFNEKLEYTTLRKIRYQELLNNVFGTKKGFSFWLYLEDHIEIFKKKNGFLLYNPANKHFLSFRNLKSKFLPEAVITNRVLIKNSDLLNKEVYNAIKQIYHYKMGGLVDTTLFNYPINFYNNKHFDIFGENENLFNAIKKVNPELTFYLNDECDKACKICNIADMQYNFCRASQTSSLLSIDVIKNTISAIIKTRPITINLIGGDWITYPDLSDLNRYLILNSVSTNYYIHYLNIRTISDIPILQVKPFFINILIQFPVVNERIKEIIMELSINKSNCKLIFLIENKKNVIEANNLCNKLDDEQFDLIPFYNGQNIGLFKKKIFLSEKDILSSLDINNVNLKHKVNIANFGKLFFTSDGNVRTNMNEKSIGNINDIPINEVLENTPVYGSSWSLMRSDVEPCKNCLYDFFCPPITNYEFVMQSNKICTLKNN